MSATMALRNAIGVVLPIVIGHALGQTGAGVLAGLGGLMVSYSDGNDPYALRSRRLFATAVLCAAAVGLGTLAANLPRLAAVLAVAWAFPAGIAVALSPAIGDLGTFSLVLFIVEGTTALSPERALAVGALCLLGGLLQMGLALVLWPLRRYEPERRELANLFAAFAREAAEPSSVRRGPPTTAEMTRVQMAVANLVGDRSVQGQRYRSLANQAERIRLRLISLNSARRRLSSGPGSPGRQAEVIDAFMKEAVRGFQLVSRALSADEIAGPPQQVLSGLQTAADAMGEVAAQETPLGAAAVTHAQFQMTALAGQMRAALDLAQGLTEPGLITLYRQETRQPWRRRATSALATLRANLTPRSTMFRHAVRLAVGVAIGELISRRWVHAHAYWVPMTVAIVLKPGYVSTVTRGTLRVLGTLVGLVLTTALFSLHPSIAWQLALIGAHVFVLRWLGVANYGFFAAAVGGLIVLLSSVAGADPTSLIADRALYTVLGGLIAVIVYVAWPTRGEGEAGTAAANLLDAYRRYLELVALQIRGQPVEEAALDRLRLQTRVLRSNAEAAVDALAGEPAAVERRKLYGAVGASSNRFAHAAMVLEAMGAAHGGDQPAGELPLSEPAFDSYAANASRTLSLLARVLRGENVSPEEFPDLRQSYEQWAKAAGDRRPLVTSELDRMTNSLNTLAERVAILRRAGT
jgi:uncharacterized membrane protein YccC